MTKRKPIFQCRMLPDITGWSIAGGGIVRSHGDRAGNILKGANYATLLAYMWRRFGPPEYGWDDHKELVCYYLTTPVAGIGFGLSCSPSFPPCGVSYAISPEWEERAREYRDGEADKWLRGFGNHCLCDDTMLLWEVQCFAKGHRFSGEFMRGQSRPYQEQAVRLVREYDERAGRCPSRRWVKEFEGGDYHDRDVVPVEQLPDSPHRTILSAIEDGLRDLLRPVNIRDSFINACGPVSDDQVSRPVSPSKRAGYGCSPELMDAGDAWWDLSEVIKTMGVKKALAKLQPKKT